MKRRLQISATFLLLLAGANLVQAADSPPEMIWYSTPAKVNMLSTEKTWPGDALPIGNGRLGAMLFSGTADERLQFNEDTLWTGKPHDYARPDAVQFLPQIRQLLADGDFAGAGQIAKNNFLGDPSRQKAYQPFGDLRLHFPGQENAEGFRRELNLDSAVARVTYKAGNVSYQREAFASYPDQAIVERISADKPGSISFTLKMDSQHKSSQTKSIAPDTLVLTGQVEEDGLRFESRVRVLIAGGKMTTEGDTITVENADSATLLLTAATSFKNYQDISGDPAARCAADQAKLTGKNFETLLAAHVKDYQNLYARVKLDLGTSPRADLPTDQRLLQIKKDGLDGDPALPALYFQFGRYLLISSSRAGGQASNLQGLWNDNLDPPWESKWTTNINVEMNYWPAEVTNLSETTGPLFDLIDDLTVSGHKTAQLQYGAGGWVLHHNTDLWRGTAPINGIDGVWPTGAAWLSYHLWEHYLFTGDKQFLAHAYPAMKGASEFFVDFLIKDPKTGWLVTSPSYSPEQGNLTAGPTMDNQLIRALFDSTMEAARILKTDADFSTKLAQVRAQLPPNRVDQYGGLMEWLNEVDQRKNNHRHMSPLWALYPGADITPVDPKIYDAAKQLLAWRGDGGTGWSYAWRSALWARVGDGDKAYHQLLGLYQRKTLPDLLSGSLYQIDANFGMTAAIAEMLLQSQLRAPDTKANEIDLLPALPSAWPTGSFTGLCARGGFEVDVAWENSTLKRVTIRSKLGNPVRLRYNGQMLDLPTEAGKQYAFDGKLNKIILR